MPEQKFAFKAGGPKRLALRSTIFGGKQDVFVDDRLIGSPTRRELAQGWRKSAGSSELYIRRLYGGWDVRMNGQPIADSYSHPVKRAHVASNVNFFVAVLTLLFAGIVAWMTRLSTPVDWIEIIVTGIIALIYAILGWFIRTRLSAVALGISIAIFLIDTVAVLLTVLAVLNPSGVIGALIVRFVLFNQLIAGVGPLLEYWRSRRVGERAAPDYALGHVFGRMSNAQRTKFSIASVALVLFTILGSIFVLSGFTLPKIGSNDTLALAVTQARATWVANLHSRTAPPPTLPPNATLPPSLVSTSAAAQPTITPLPLRQTLPPTWTPTPLVPATATMQPTNVITSALPTLPPAVMPILTTPPIAQEMSIPYPAGRVMYDRVSNRLYGLDVRVNPNIAQLWWLDMATREVGVIPTQGNGQEMCIHPVTNLLYFITQQTGIIQVFDPQQNAVIQQVDWVANVSLEPGDPPQPYDMSCQLDRLFMTDSQRSPGLWSLDPADLSAPPQRYTLEPITIDGSVFDGGFGEYAFTPDGQLMYFWTQATSRNPFIVRAQMDGTRIVMLTVSVPDTPEDGFREFPMNAPVFFDVSSSRLVTRRAIFSGYNLHLPLFMLPLDATRSDLEEVFYAVDFQQGYAASRFRIVDLSDFSSVRMLPTGIEHVFFGPGGALYMVDNDTLRLTALGD